MNRIRVMPADLSLKIAAGEVIERPSSAVKELLDNAIDARARTIAVEIRDAGLKMIRVTDDGAGIPRGDLPLAFQSHATSKIADLADLERLTTLGFRGEALPSIAAVSRTEVLSKADGECVGTRYSVEYGQPGDLAGCATPRGLRVVVHDLFSNVPARRKFVRSYRSEAGHIGAVIMQYALAQPSIRFSLLVDGRPAFDSPGTDSLSDAFGAIYGGTALGRMIPIDALDKGISISGLISRPQLDRQNRSAIHVIVNGRPISNKSLSFALEEAYSGFLMTGRHPFAVVHIHLDPTDVDVNVHPAKSQVRFAREREVHGAVHRATADALLTLRLESTNAAGIVRGAPVLEDGDFDAQPLMSPGDDLPALPLTPTVPALRVFGQTNQTFIVAEGPGGLYMIDQHAAHERILFDRFDTQMSNGAIPSQPLLEPAAVALTPVQMQALDENADLLVRLGFLLEPFGDDTCLIRSVPVLARSGTPLDSTIEILDELSSMAQPSTARQRALASLACRAAVKAGQILDMHEMREIVAQLETTDRPSTCPHGRPTMIHLSNMQLEREFGRR